MPKAAAAGLDVAVQDDGSALYTFSAVDADGYATAIPAGTPPLSNIVVTDPGAVGGVNLWNVVLNPNDATGMSLVGTPTSPIPASAVLPDVGIGVTAQTTFPGATGPVTGTAPLIDLVSGPANSLVAQVSATNPAT